MKADKIEHTDLIHKKWQVNEDQGTPNRAGQTIPVDGTDKDGSKL